MSEQLDDYERRYADALKKLCASIQKDCDDSLALDPSEALRRDIETLQALMMTPNTQPLTWTRERPTRPGLWLCTWHEAVTAVTVARDQDGKLWIYRIGESGGLPVDTLSRRELYCGPIEPPPLPEAQG